MKEIEGQLVFTIGELKALPTLCVGQTDDLKFDNGEIRVWVSRCGLADFELDPISVECLIDGCWVNITTDYYGPQPVHVIGQALGVRSGIGWVKRAR